MTLISNLIRFGRRQLHTIVSTETIKPSFPTPCHLKTYNLSAYDQLLPSSFNPLVMFYPTGYNSHTNSHDLKNSLSHTLTKYYPFAGRHAKIAPTYVDCNDQGAEFIEASIDSSLLDFLHNSQCQDLDLLFPYARTWSNGYANYNHNHQSDNEIPLAVQVNRFECGGVALAVSLSHKVADAYSLIRLLSDWAKMTRVAVCSKLQEVSVDQPHFISFQKTNLNFSGFSLEASNDCLTRSFLFSNSMINKLKLKVIAMTTAGCGHPITKPTRVEVLTWLLYKCALRAATETNLGCFEPACIRLVSNVRDKMIEPLPENSIGNFLTGLEVVSNNETELTPEFLIGEFKNQKKKLKSLKNIDAFLNQLLNQHSNSDLQESQRKFTNAYSCTSLCGYPLYGMDFGWGTPLKVTAPGNLRKKSFIMMDAPNQEGVQVYVCLGKQDMDIFTRDPELLYFAKSLNI